MSSTFFSLTVGQDVLTSAIHHPKKKHFGFGTAVRNCIILCASNILDKKFEVTTHITLKKVESSESSAKYAVWKEPTRQSSICVSDTEILSKTRRLEHVRNQLGQCFFVAFLVPFTYRARDAVHCPSWVKSSHTRWSKHVSNSRHLSLFPNLQEIVDDHPLMAVLHLSNL